MKVVRFLLSLALGIVLPLLVQRWDKRRLPREKQQAAWNTASWAAALYNFGPLSMIGWVWVTRQDFKAWWAWHRRIAVGMTVALLVAGTLAAMVVSLAIVAVDTAIESLTEVRVHGGEEGEPEDRVDAGAPRKPDPARRRIQR